MKLNPLEQLLTKNYNEELDEIKEVLDKIIDVIDEIVDVLDDIIERLLLSERCKMCKYNVELVKVYDDSN
ncbi:MAG TPA: hypothetical protein VIK84_05865 [Haloplasmataceae bacterium]